MANSVKFSQKRFAWGISDYLKESALDRLVPNSSFVMAKAVNFRDDPQAITLLPGAVKESGSVVIDLIKWGEVIPTSLNYYFYGNAGNIYKRTSGGSWSNLHTAASSHGNGLGYFTGDDYLYYATDSALGRYGPISGSTPQFSDNFLQAQGGVPTNTNALSLVVASSQYASAADSASLSVTGDLTLEAYFYMNSFPTVGNSMTILGKWDESGALRSYKMDIYGVSGYFGNGSDGALTISANTTEAPIDAACTGTAGTQTLSATNASFAQGQIVLIHQSQGTNAGQWERNTIQGYSAGTITLGTPLIGTYTSGAQVRVLKQYSSVTVNNGITWTAKAWNGSTGGLLAFLCSGTVTINGTVSADSCGFRGGTSVSVLNSGIQGEGNSGVGATSYNANGTGGGGGYANAIGSAGGGGGGYSTSGVGASAAGTTTPNNTAGGNTAGTNDLTDLQLGGGGGSGGAGQSGGSGTGSSGTGGAGGGILFLTGTTITNSGTLSVGGSNGGNASSSSANCGGGGGGAAGSILLKAQTATLGTLNLNPGNGGTKADTGSSSNGGAGGAGRFALYYLTSYTNGTINGSPTSYYLQDNTLVTTTTYQARLGISNDGTAFEYLTQNLNSLALNQWNRLSISWSHSTSVATFYLNAVSLGTATGTKTAISDNTSLLYIGANKGASTVQNFFDGLLDDIRIWGNVQTASQIFTNNQVQLTGNEGGLKAYYKLNNALTDSTSNTNTLTNSGTTFSTNVPFPDATTRLDIDQSYTTNGSTYTLPTSISEATTDILSLSPVNDPQKSIAFNVSSLGTGDWTVTIHDQQNNLIASQTITHANMASSGWQEFIFDTPWRVVSGKTYHAHLTVSTGTSAVVSSTLNDFSKADFYTYFGFLVTDTAFHPITPFLNLMVVGNERYLATWDGAFYHPNYIAFPPGWKIRCFGFWREFLAIGVWKGTNIYDYPFGRVYFWDGIAPTFNFFIDIGEGQVNALFGRDSDLYMVVGYRTYLYDYAGGYFYNTGNTKSNKLKRLPNNQIPETDSQEVFPGALTMWRSMLHVGLNAVSNSTTVEKGVYSYGSYNKDYPDTLSYDYPISTGNTGSTVAIGCVYPAGKQLIIGWQDGIAYGADVIDFANPPASSGYIHLLVQDDGAIWKQKSQLSVRADYLALKSGESVDVKYKVDRAASWTVSPVDATVGDTSTQFNVSGGRGREYQLGVDLYATGTTSPTLLGVSLLGDTLAEEKTFG